MNLRVFSLPPSLILPATPQPSQSIMLRTRQASKAVRALAQTSRQQHRSFTTSPVSSSVVATTKKAPSGIRNQTTAAQSSAYVPVPASHLPRALADSSCLLVFMSSCLSDTDTPDNNSETRAVPAPAFNTNSTKDSNHVQPLVNPRAVEMDESYVIIAVLYLFRCLWDQRIIMRN